MAASVQLGIGSTASTTEEQLSDGIALILKPSIEILDEKVALVKSSQTEVSNNISFVGDELRGIADTLPNPQELDPHIKRLANARRKVNIVNSILTNCQERLRKVHAQAVKESQRRAQALPQTAPSNIQGELSAQQGMSTSDSSDSTSNIQEQAPPQGEENVSSDITPSTEESANVNTAATDDVITSPDAADKST